MSLPSKLPKPSRLELALREAIWSASRPTFPALPGGLRAAPDATWYQEQSAVRDREARASTMLSQHQADPIFTPIFTAILGTGGFTLFGTTVTWASIASAIATTALLAGAQYLLMKPPKPDMARQPLTQSIPYRFWGVGETRLAGAMMCWEAKDRKLVSVQAICAHPINAYKQYFLHDDQVTLTGNNVNPGFRNRYGNNIVKIYTRTGSVPGDPIDEIVSILGADGIWTEDHRGDGQAYVGMVCTAVKRASFTDFYPYGKPVLSVVAELAKCWDFRDPDQDPDDESTRVFTKNPVVQLCWHECFSPFGPRRDFRKAILPVLDMWQEEADVCDEPIARAIGGTEPRYEANGYDTTENDPKVGTNALLAAMDGWICERGDGALLVVAGKFREKYVATLTDADIVGHAIQHDVLPEEEVNRLVPKFIYPAIDYGESDTDYFEDTAAQLTAGRVLSRDAAFDWVTAWRQARRLGKREFLRLRAKKRGRLDVRLTGVNAVYAPWVRLDTPKRLPSLDGMVFSNRKALLNLKKGGYSIDVIAMPDDIDAWTPATDEGSAPPVPPSPTQSDYAIPTIDSIFAQPSSGSVYLQVFIVDPNDDSLVPVVQWRVKDTGSGEPGAWVTQEYEDAEPDGGLILLSTSAVPADAVLEVQVAFRNASGTIGSYTSPPEEVESTVDTVAPGALSGGSVTGGQLGHADLAWTAPASVNLHAVRIYRAPTGVTLDRATHFVEEVPALPGVAGSYIDGDDTVTSGLANTEFNDTTGLTLPSGWSHVTDRIRKSPGVANGVSQAFATTTGTVIRYAFELANRTAGTIWARFTVGATLDGAAVSTNAVHVGSVTATANHTTQSWRCDSTFDGDVLWGVAFNQTVDCAPQGTFDYYLEAVNGSGVPGTTSGPHTALIY